MQQLKEIHRDQKKKKIKLKQKQKIKIIKSDNRYQKEKRKQ